MADKPIIFSGPMVRALIAGTKTQTRRTLKKPYETLELTSDGWKPVHTKIHVGDRLWVRENWKATGLAAFKKPSETRICGRFAYMADIEQLPRDTMISWRPSIHMPRWASRLTLTVTDVRVERLQDINADDADAECFGGGYPGTALPELFPGDPDQWGHLSMQECYFRLWDHINGKGAADANPWVVAYTFTVHRGNIDQIARAAA